MRAMCDHTAVMRRNEIVTIRRSMNGIMLISESSDLRPPPPPPTLTPPILVYSVKETARPAGNPGDLALTWLREREPLRRDGGEVDLLTVRDDEVEHLDARLVDVVLDLLGLAVEDGV